ncbi:hypothetical protein IW261DRAFT_1492899 [Armillaria novae-zelandiae]|uniref:HMG box domain-containing protein n=1 Tax=Armillaria novae-zelandiae TaxID=153914 RepID=A0AA39P2H6_9AGAR|nr:hypothetical protein IW261DRAFT_1492899 [Armillaria novae-zelandiae]
MAHYALFPGDLAPAHNNGSLAPPATRTSNALTSLPFYAAAQPSQTLHHRRSPRPRDAFTIFLHVFTAQYKNRLPTHRNEVRLIARPIWDGLAREERHFYETLARQEREFCERNHTTPVLQRHVSARDGGSRNSGEHQMVLPRSVLGRDIPHRPIAQVDPQAFVNRVPIRTPTAVSESLRTQYPNSSVMNVNTDVLVAHNVHTTEGQVMIDVQHEQARQGMPTSHQWPASISIPPAVTETSIGDSQIRDSVPFYRDTSGQSFLIMDRPTTPQYLPSAPVAVPIAHRPNPVATLLTHHQFDGNTYNQGLGELSTVHTSASSSTEVGSFNYGGGSTHGEGSSAYYGHPAESTWDGFQDNQRQFWSSDHSGQSS